MVTSKSLQRSAAITLPIIPQPSTIIFFIDVINIE
jgi:hypothetical protein